MKTLWIIHAPGTLAYQVCKDDEELSVPYVPRSEYEALQARVKELEQSLNAAEATAVIHGVQNQKLRRVVDAVKTARWHPRSAVGIALLALEGEKEMPVGEAIRRQRKKLGW